MPQELRLKRLAPILSIWNGIFPFGKPSEINPKLANRISFPLNLHPMSHFAKGRFKCGHTELARHILPRLHSSTRSCVRGSTKVCLNATSSKTPI
ncbi:hypothetical protein Nepgr_018483 [Nepenthes gracilis]|uniref:Uncharacterized protein n=1 Tax=Nepenthes gracilis TaxID=150966 RepID=A0AAD3ST66_NEPGR|nr:hypothetical protein Nepgr_018483 [Nepenthes gracilis]